MSSNGKTLNNLSVDEFVAVDKVCLQFEDQWLAGQTPEINDFLTGFQGAERTAALIELVTLDLEYRQRHQLSVTPDQYHIRFPQDALSIEKAFANLNRNASEESPQPAEPEESDTLPFERLRLENEYEVEELYARGGLGEIYLAYDKKLDRKVAIKVLRNRDPHSQERMRLQREAEVTSRLKHPGIVPVHAASNDGVSAPCYIMEFIEGQTCREMIDDFHASHEASRKKFYSREFRRMLQQLISVCNTVAYAHDQGVIHRDIKPSNIMVGKFGETFLLDWGLAKEIFPCQIRTDDKPNPNSSPPETLSRAAADETAATTKPGCPIGTPEFASPEQIQGKVHEQDGRCDVYSLGATLYYLLVGKRAIETEDLTNLLTARAIREISPPRQINPKVPRDLDAICMKALAFDAADRFQRVSDFSDELERFITDEPIRTRQQPWPTRVRRWLKENPRKAYSIATGITVGLIALLISTLMLTQKADELSSALATQQELNAELKTAKDSAEAYAEKTEQALRTLANRIDETWFASRKTFSQNEKQLLQDLLTQYREFAQLSPNPHFTRTVEAGALFRVGKIQMLLGQPAEAIESFTQATNLLDPLPEDASENDRMLKSHCVYQLGALLCHRGMIEDGLPKLQFAFELTESMSRDFSENAEHLARMAIIQAKIGTINLQMKKPTVAYEHLISAKKIAHDLVDLHPDNDHFRQTYATRTAHLGKAYLQFSDYEQSLAEYRAAVDVFESLGNEEWIFSGVARSLEYCVACNGIASSLSSLEREQESMTAWQKAKTAATRLAKTFPAFPYAYSNLAVPTFQSAKRFRKLKDWPLAIENAQLAVEAIEKAVKLSAKQPNFVRFRTVIQKELGLILQDSGDLVAAKAAQKQAVIFARESFELDPAFANGIHSNRLELARTLRCLARVQIQLDDQDSARVSFNEAIKILEAAENESQAPYVLQELKDTRQELLGIEK